MMKTITEAVNEHRSRTGYERERKVSEAYSRVYGMYPELKRIDSQLLEVRATRLISSIENDSDPVPQLLRREEELLGQRASFLSQHGIDPDFDRTRPVCERCGDTCFVTAKDGRSVICTSCMAEDVESVYNQSGMADFSSFTLKSFKLGYFNDKNSRGRQFDSLKGLLSDPGGKGIMLLTGGAQTGKTYLSVVICKYAIVTGKTSYYVKADRLSDLPGDDLESLKRYDIVIIDDYAAEITGNYRAAACLHTLLEGRLAGDLPTVIVSSSSKEHLVAESDERIAGKLKLAGTV